MDVVLGAAMTASNDNVQPYLAHGSVAGLASLGSAVFMPVVSLMREPKTAGGPVEVGG